MNGRYQITEFDGGFELVDVVFDEAKTTMPNGNEVQFLSMTYCDSGEEHRIDEKLFGLLSPVKQRAAA